MTDRPMSFSGPMIRALIDGRKTQHRLPLKRLRRFGAIREFGPSTTRGYDWQFRDRDGRWNDLRDAELRGALPYAPGDRLWVREPFRLPAVDDFYSPSEVGKMALQAGYAKPWSAIQFEADGRRINWQPDYGEPGRLRPSIHMPRWASRITLIVTDVPVQRLQEISEEDAEAEGARPAFSYPGWDGVSSVPCYRWGFHDLWDSLNAKRGLGWDANPWVPAISFTVHLCNIDAMEAAA